MENTYSPKIGEFLVRSRSFLIKITRSIVDKRESDQDYEEEFEAGVEIMDFLNQIQDPFNTWSGSEIEQAIDYYAVKHGMVEKVVNMIDPLNTRYRIKTIVSGNAGTSVDGLPSGQGILVRDSLGLRFRAESDIIDQGTIDDL